MPDPNANINPTGHLTNVGPYNPYSGREVLDIIMKRIYTQLKEHQVFGSHLSYTEFGYSFTLSLDTKAIEPTVIKGKESSAIRLAETSFTIEGTSLAAPDDGRREAGLVVPKPTNTLGGMVDIPMQSQTPA